MMNDIVSVIVPVYNAAGVIVDTIRSVMDQSYEHIELILVDDASTDNGREVIKEYLRDNIILLENKNTKGAAGARNTGIEAATGRYIAFLDADDMWKADKLSKQIAFMKEKKAAFSFTGYEFADENCKGLGRIVTVPGKLSYKEALKNTTIFTSTVIFDTDKLDKRDIMMPYVKSEDTATWWKVLKSGHTAYGLDENLTLYRRTGESLSSDKVEAIRRIWNLYRNVEHLGIVYSCYCFCFWAYRAVARRV
ncbi:MAG: glycosyltransferase [Lachnospiraceae bacterium]|nr:glycosyltransferase [Lachnospiraceae bacterium]